MIEVLPIKILRDEDSPIFGPLNVLLGKLQRAEVPVANGAVVTPPNLKLQVVLKHYDFGTREVFEQSLTLVKKEISSAPVPEILAKEAGKHKIFFISGKYVKGVKALWIELLNIWLDEIKIRIWKDGFYKGVTEGLDPQVVIFPNKVEAFGSAFFDPLQDDSVINLKEGKLEPKELKKLHEAVGQANKMLLIPHDYEWILDGDVKISKIRPYTMAANIQSYKPGLEPQLQTGFGSRFGSKSSSELGPRSSSLSDEANSLRVDDLRGDDKPKSTIKVFIDLSTGLVVEYDIDGIYIAGEKSFDLNKPKDSFEDMLFRLVESSMTFPNRPVLFKLADKSEGMGKVRGTLRLLHQKNLLDPMIEALDFARFKKGLSNIHIVVPYVRGLNEFLQIKRELAVKKLGRKNSLQLWLEAAVPENVINLEEYLVAGLDGVILNLDEMISHLNGFDPKEQELIFYKNEVEGLINFLEDGIKLINKSKVPFIGLGTAALNPKVLEYLVEHGVYGVVVERYEAQSAKDLLYTVEKSVLLRKV